MGSPQNSPPVTPFPDREWEDCLKLAQSRGLKAVRITPEILDSDLIKAMPQEMLLNYHLLPLTRNGFELTVAMADPLDVVAEDLIRQISGCRVVPVVALAREIEDALQGRLSPDESPMEAILRHLPEIEGLAFLNDDPEPEETEDAAELEPKGPIIQLVNSLLGDAIRMNASDIHVEPMRNSLRVRYRLDGALRTIAELPKKVQSACLSRLKLMAGIDISETRKPQDGRVRVRVDQREVDLRVSSLPTFRGERMVMRVLDSQAMVMQLAQLGFSPTDFESLQRILTASQGMILCTGPTGSGKTSTLYAALQALNQDSDNIITVEDPVEYQLEGVNQVQIHVRAGLTFASALRSILRQDPDVVLIGEIRDQETAEIALQAAQTGHLVLSTLHTNDALSTLSRLVLMGVAPYMVASSLLCVIAQRLVRKLCAACRQPTQASERAVRLLELAGQTPPAHLWQAAGCEKCHYIGYKGRLGLYELLVVSDRIREMLLSGVSEADLEVVARQEGTRSLLEDGLAKCGQGLTSLDEVLRVLTVRQKGGRVCPSCQRNLPGELSICPYCGDDLDVICPDCHKAVQVNWRLCPFCRHPLSSFESPNPTEPQAH